MLSGIVMVTEQTMLAFGDVLPNTFMVMDGECNDRERFAK